MRVFGVSVVTILLVIGSVIVGRGWGSKIPGVNSIPAG